MGKYVFPLTAFPIRFYGIKSNYIKLLTNYWIGSKVYFPKGIISLSSILFYGIPCEIYVSQKTKFCCMASTYDDKYLY